MTFRPVGAEMLHADGRTDRHDEGNFTFNKKPLIVIYLRNKNQQYASFLRQSFNLIIASSTCFEHPNVHPQEDACMQFYGISFMYP